MTDKINIDIQIVLSILTKIDFLFVSAFPFANITSLRKKTNKIQESILGVFQLRGGNVEKRIKAFFSHNYHSSRVSFYVNEEIAESGGYSS